MIYLDHAATTPVAPLVAEAMRPWLTERWGNPSSIHATGREARAALDDARDTLAAALNADYSEITFTSSGTEADNLAIIGTALASSHSFRLITTQIEHHAVLHSARFLETQGYSVAYLPVDSFGYVEPGVLEETLKNDVGQPALVSILHGNNEIGTIQDVKALAEIAHTHGALFHTDAVQTFGSLSLDVMAIDCDLLSVSAHKLYGPKGVGALYARTGVKISPILFGGAQERERRAGTENLPGIVGFGKAVELMQADREEESIRLAALRDRFIATLFEQISDLQLNGSMPASGRRLPNNVNIAIPEIDGAAVLMSLDRAGIAASSGSACSSGSIEPSHVLRAIGLPDSLAASGIRFSLGRGTTQEALAETVEVLSGIIERMRN